MGKVSIPPRTYNEMTMTWEDFNINYGYLDTAINTFQEDMRTLSYPEQQLCNA